MFAYDMCVFVIVCAGTICVVTQCCEFLGGRYFISADINRQCEQPTTTELCGRCGRTGDSILESISQGSPFINFLCSFFFASCFCPLRNMLLYRIYSFLQCQSTFRGVDRQITWVSCRKNSKMWSFIVYI